MICVPKFRYSTLQQTTRHWWSPTSCFGANNHSEAVSLWLVRQDWANNNSGSPPSCADPFCQWSVAMPSELFDWQVRYLDIYLFYAYGWDRESTWLTSDAEYDGPVLLPLVLIQTKLKHLGVHRLSLLPSLVETNNIYTQPVSRTANNNNNRAIRNLEPTTSAPWLILSSSENCCNHTILV